MFVRDKSNALKRDERLVKKAVKVFKTAKEDNSDVQKEAARKIYKASFVND